MVFLKSISIFVVKKSQVNVESKRSPIIFLAFPLMFKLNCNVQLVIPGVNR